MNSEVLGQKGWFTSHSAFDKVVAKLSPIQYAGLKITRQI